MTAYYNEHEPYAAQWLRNLIAAGQIAPGDVDARDRCTHVLLLPRWETSPGAVAERDYARTIGMPVITSLEELEATEAT